MKEHNKKIWWLLEPKEHGGFENMLLFFMSIATAGGALIYKLIQFLTDAE